MADPLKSLLTWSIANTDTSNRPRAPRAALHPSDNEPKPRSDLTSDMLDHIMGKSDAVVMREKLNIALDENNDVNERVFALDDFEMVSFNIQLMKQDLVKLI
jgi:hsp70-interacting protein